MTVLARMSGYPRRCPVQELCKLPFEYKRYLDVKSQWLNNTAVAVRIRKLEKDD